MARRHPLSQEFHDRMDSNKRLHDKKQADYGTDENPFANICATSDWCCPNCHEPLPAWLGAMIRASDKVHRLQTYARRGTLENEGVRDAFRDLSVYAGIADVVFTHIDKLDDQKG